jgi:hypothetical protein
LPDTILPAVLPTLNDGITTRPSGYEAAKHALCQALERNDIFGRFGSIVRIPTTDRKINKRSLPIDVEKSIVWFHSVKSWLSEQGITTGFFFSKASGKPKNHTPDYLDPNHPRYALKLAAAIKAWLAVGENATTNGRSAKHALTKWLTENAAELGLVDSQGKTNSSGIEEIAKVANWQLTGGAPRTSGSS